MIEELRRVCELQPSYSWRVTDAMKERGRLIRRDLPSCLREMGPEFRDALGPFGADFAVQASDGLTRKTEAPWVRVCSREMSPSPREGFYVVIHFAANGSAVFITVGCGSTVWAKGEFRPISDGELERRTGWARAIVSEALGSLEPFGDQIDLGAKAALPRSFEKATALAQRFAVEALDEQLIRKSLLAATDRLRLIYEAQRVGREATIVDLLEVELHALSRPPRSRGGGGQGYGLTAPERKAVELRAMALAREWLVANGYTVKDTSANSPFDFAATKSGVTLKVEVKGTTSDSPEAIFMTHNEVELHRRELGATALFIASKIRLQRTAAGPTATGGELSAEIGWDIGGWDLAPLAYRVSKRPTVLPAVG